MTNFKVYKGLGILRKMHDFLQEAIKKSLFTMHLSNLSMNMVYQPGEEHLIKTKRSLNKAMRIMLFKGKFESAQPLFQQWTIVLLHLNINLQQSKFTKKLILCQHLDSIQEYLPITYTTSINNTNNIKLILPYHRTSVEVPSLFYQSFTTWNSVPKNIQECHSLNTFAKEYQNYILQVMTESMHV